MTLNQRKQILEELDLHEHLLSSYDWEFVRDLRTRLEEKPHLALSDKQEEHLEKVHRRVMKTVDDPSGFDHGDYAGW